MTIGSITASSSNRMKSVDRAAWRDLQAWLAEQTLITARSTYRLDLLSEDGRDYRAHVFRTSAGRPIVRNGQVERDSQMLADWRIEDMELARRRQTVEDEQLAAIADMRTFVARSTVVLDGLAMRLTAIEHHIGLDPTLPAEGTPTQ